MTLDQFRHQVGRLRERFGDRAFDEEFVLLLWREVHNISARAFEKCCDVMLETRPHHRAPLMPDFREFAVAERNRQFKQETARAATTLRKAPEEMLRHLRIITTRDFGTTSWKDVIKHGPKSDHDPEPDGAA